MRKTSETKNQSFVNGALVVNSMLIDVDYDCDNIIIPDDVQSVNDISCNINILKIKKITLHSLNFLKALISHKSTDLKKNIKCSPKHIVIDCSLMTNSIELEETIQNVFCCTNVEHVDIINHNKYTTLDGSILYDKHKKMICACPFDRKGKVNIPEGPVCVESMAFYGSSIESIALPDSLREIEDSAFAYCLSLKYVSLGNGIMQLGSSYNECVFAACDSLRFIDIPSQVQVIGTEAFAESGLESISFHEGLLDIKSDAFLGCSKLKEVTIPDSVKFISQNAFSKILKIKASKYIPMDFIWSFNSKNQKDCDKALPPMVELEIGSKSVMVPRCMTVTAAEKVDNILQKYFNEKEDEYITNQVKHLYMFALTEEDKQDVAIQTLKRNSNDKYTKEYLRQVSNDIIARMGNEKDEQGLTDIINLKIAKKKELLQILQIAQNKHMTALIAQVLENLNKYPSKDERFHV